MRKKATATNVEVKTKKAEEKAVEKTAKTAVEPRVERPRGPFTLMRRFAEDMEDMFGGFRLEKTFPAMSLFERDPFDLWNTDFFNDFSPPVEMFEKDGKLIVRTDLPGLEKDDIDVEITDRLLTIKGERKNEFEEEKEGFFRTERSYGNFFRQVALPASIKTEDAHAMFKNGVLEITMLAPKGVLNKKKLEITEGEAKSKAVASGGTK